MPQVYGKIGYSRVFRRIFFGLLPKMTGQGPLLFGGGFLKGSRRPLPTDIHRTYALMDYFAQCVAVFDAVSRSGNKNTTRHCVKHRDTLRETVFLTTLRKL